MVPGVDLGRELAAPPPYAFVNAHSLGMRRKFNVCRTGGRKEGRKSSAHSKVLRVSLGTLSFYGREGGGLAQK